MAEALVVDDSRAVRRFVGATLSDLGWTVQEAASAPEALAYLESQERSPALMTLDWNMPEVSGMDLLRDIRSQARFRRCVILMITSETRAEQVAQALLAGADDYVMKPFTEDVLKEKLTLLGIRP